MFNVQTCATGEQDIDQHLPFHDEHRYDQLGCLAPAEHAAEDRRRNRQQMAIL